MNVFIFIGGAYADEYWQSQNAPTKEQWECWHNGEVVIIRIDADGQAYEPSGINEWKQIRHL